MKQLFETNELIGKTIIAVAGEYDYELILTFSDETFCVIHDEIDGSDISISEDDFDIHPNRKNYAKLYEAKLINKYVHDELHDFFTHMTQDEEKERFLEKRREEIHMLQQLAQRYPDIATLK